MCRDRCDATRRRGIRQSAPRGHDGYSGRRRDTQSTRRSASPASRARALRGLNEREIRETSRAALRGGLFPDLSFVLTGPAKCRPPATPVRRAIHLDARRDPSSSPPLITYLTLNPFAPHASRRPGQEGVTMMDNISPRYQLRVKQRRRVVEFAEDDGFRVAARHFGLARRTVRTWWRWNAKGPRPTLSGSPPAPRVGGDRGAGARRPHRIPLGRHADAHMAGAGASDSCQCQDHSAGLLRPGSRRRRSARRDSSSSLKKRGPATRCQWM
jgi:hypothetical protein